MYTVSFIVVNYNGSKFIESCINSIYEQVFTDFEIIIVDNNSEDRSTELIKQKFPNVKLVKLNSNKGFTGGNNAGLKIASGKYIALVNNDVILDRYWLHYMTKGIEEFPDIGLCSSKIIISGTDKIDSIGDKFTTAFTGTKVGEYQPEKNFNTPLDMNGVCAASALYKRKMIDRIGFFDDMFFLNHEDTDLNMRAWLAGYKCRFIPKAIAYHDVNRTIGTLSNTSVYYFSRNNVWVWLINVPLYFMLRNAFQRIIYEVTAALFYCVIHKKYKPFLKGKIDALVSLKSILQKRKQVQQLTNLSTHQIKNDLIPIMEYVFNKLKI